ncbi:hypothetical protein TVAG_024710 [Trichomonas vaginalis G3]|uniref:LysM domain-containing protein n=1 Tax=Trichomonas vaginalis (strain ATCC PRA-98 / G3) TaxID=412133 RepID=A2FF48_TRIV3|nr:LysM domain-containing protein [Trichomonas vaginalis G3]EAX96461.1 hypothetical protein TVAG_024710 [Trichomonas vaginalis G3]KAI5503324.1 LysM domain-containing protein [Trichomonas vaginalis G3]|eukprot:XP_001309391.1 hypothetical protein [Trichomonas vaginalis G3]
MISWIIATRFQKLPRPPHFDVPQQNGDQYDDKCAKRIFNDTPFTIEGIARLYHVTVDDIKQANPGIGYNIPEGLILKIPQKCPETMDETLYMDSPDFKSAAVLRNGALLLCFCYMFSTTNAEQCETFMKYNHGFDQDGNLVNIHNAMDYAYIKNSTDCSEPFGGQYQLRQYNINGKYHCAVKSNIHFYDPGRNIVKDSYPYTSLCFEEK